MRWIAVVCVVLSLAAFGAAWLPEPFPENKKDGIELFRVWREEHARQYRTRAEERLRFATFLGNVKLVNQLNEQHRGEPVFALNQFADMTPEEFKSTLLMASRAPPVHPQSRYMTVEVPTSLPTSFDWTAANQTKKVVTSVKNQGSVGSCWAFSTVGNVEGQWGMQGKPLVDLSVEQIVDCDDEKDPAKGVADCGVFGGWPYLAYQYIEKAGGIEAEVNYTYCSGIGGGPGTCFPCEPKDYNVTLCGPKVWYCLKNESCHAKIDPKKFVQGLQVTGWKAVSKNETEMAAALMTTGPLSVALDAVLLQFYHRGVFAPLVGCGKTLDHAVLLVGWGIEGGLLEKKPFWKVKNSWGPKWGEHGYFRIKRGSGECGINTAVTTAVLKK